MTKTDRQTPWVAIIGAALLLVIIIVGGLIVLSGGPMAAQAPQTQQTAEVQEITFVSTVEGSGTVEARQTATLFWGTTGRVAEIDVEVGDQVEAGDILMRLDPTSAPANVISAQTEVISAQDALDDLLNPGTSQVMEAEKATVDAYDALLAAEDTLAQAVEDADIPTELEEDVTAAEEALTEARNEMLLSTADLDTQRLYRAMRQSELAWQRYQDLQEEYEENDRADDLRDNLDAAENAYEEAQSREDELAEALDDETAAEVEALAQAYADYADALRTLLEGVNGDTANQDIIALQQAHADLRLAEEALFDAITTLEETRIAPNPDDVAAAEARLQAARANVDLLTITAPFSGQVMEVNYQPGDLVEQSRAALIEADRSELLVTVSIDEAEWSQIAVGDTVDVTFSALSDLAAEGTVTRIGQMGQTVQGLVRYDVDILLEGETEAIPLGLTADVSIEVAREESAIAVPLDALQNDADGEYVNLVTTGGEVERVTVESVDIQNELVVIQGDVQAGDTVQIPSPEPDVPGGPPFGG